MKLKPSDQRGRPKSPKADRRQLRAPRIYSAATRNMGDGQEPLGRQVGIGKEYLLIARTNRKSQKIKLFYVIANCNIRNDSSGRTLRKNTLWNEWNQMNNHMWAN